MKSGRDNEITGELFAGPDCACDVVVPSHRRGYFHVMCSVLCEGLYIISLFYLQIHLTVLNYTKKKMSKLHADGYANVV